LNYLSRPKTRAINKLRLNSKSVFHPDIKKENLIILDDDTMENTEEGKEQSLVTSSNKLKEVKLEHEEEHYNELVEKIFHEKQRKNEKGKQIVEHQIRHVTKETKNIGVKSEDLSKSSLKRDYLIVLEENIEKTEIKQEFDYILET
jgi:hypothetical protein